MPIIKYEIYLQHHGTLKASEFANVLALNPTGTVLKAAQVDLVKKGFVNAKELESIYAKLHMAFPHKKVDWKLSEAFSFLGKK